MRAATSIAPWLIETLPSTPVGLLTLVNINTAPAVRGEFVSLPAVTSVRAPEVCAVVATDIGYLHALVNINTSLPSWLEALLADTSVGS